MQIILIFSEVILRAKMKKRSQLSAMVLYIFVNVFDFFIVI